MTAKEKLCAGLIIVAAVATFYALINFLGGYGAIISAFTVVGLLTSNPNE